MSPVGRSDSEEGAPRAEPQGPPRDLYPTSDIRFVIVEISKLTERVDNLIDKVADLKADVKESLGKLGKVEKSIATAQGGLKVLAGLFALALVIVGAVLAWKLKT